MRVGLELRVEEAHWESEGELERVMVVVPVTLWVEQELGETVGVVEVVPHTERVGEVDSVGDKLPVMLEDRVALREVVAQ